MEQFAKALKTTFDNEVSVSENGAIGFKTSGKKLVDLNFATSTLRNSTDQEIINKFADAFYENALLAVKWLFFARDIRGGMGERRIFRVCLKWLAQNQKPIAKAVLPVVAEYGRFDDLFELAGTELWDDVVKLVDEQLTADYDNMKAGKPFSLLAKWMPSVNASSPKSVTLAKEFARSLNLSEKQYRKMLSALRAALKVVEVNASANKWTDIDYNTVPSKANLKYKDAFLKHDEARRRSYLDALSKPESGAKINAAAAFPCDIVHKYRIRYGYAYAEDAALEAMWKALPDFVAGNDHGKTIVVADGSGSMEMSVGGGQMTALEVANSLAVYFAEKLEGPFKNKYITFSEHPQFVDFSGAKTLLEKLMIALRHNECANTNIEAVFDMILDTALRSNLSQEELPANILVVSDMEFDRCTYGNEILTNRYGYWNADKTALFSRIAARYNEHGYKLPRLVFWNVASRTGTIPLRENENGVALVSGYSPAIAKMVFSAKTDPFEALVDTLNSPRYNIVGQLVKGVV